MDRLASASTKNTWPDLQFPRACLLALDTCGKAKKLFALQPLFVDRIDESASSRHRCCPLHTSPRSVHEPRGWRGEDARAIWRGLFSASQMLLFTQIAKWASNDLPANTENPSPLCLLLTQAAARTMFRQIELAKTGLTSCARMIAANADSYRQIGPQSCGLARDEIIRNMMGDEWKCQVVETRAQS
jgi:hypothetical protein